MFPSLSKQSHQLVTKCATHQPGGGGLSFKPGHFAFLKHAILRLISHNQCCSSNPSPCLSAFLQKFVTAPCIMQPAFKTQKVTHNSTQCKVLILHQLLNPAQFRLYHSMSDSVTIFMFYTVHNSHCTYYGQ